MRQQFDYDPAAESEPEDLQALPLVAGMTLLEVIAAVLTIWAAMRELNRRK